MSELLRAWNLLKEDERPEGMLWSDRHNCFVDGDAEDSPDDWDERNSYEAYDRLTLALERKLLRAGWGLVWNFRMYCWHQDKCEDDYQHSDQLTAACLAAESMKNLRDT